MTRPLSRIRGDHLKAIALLAWYVLVCLVCAEWMRLFAKGEWASEVWTRNGRKTVWWPASRETPQVTEVLP